VIDTGGEGRPFLDLHLVLLSWCSQQRLWDCSEATSPGGENSGRNSVVAFCFWKQTATDGNNGGGSDDSDCAES
jgi:hypothetical protein